MHAVHRLRCFTIYVVSLVGWTCSFPEDQSPKVFVLIEAPHTFLLGGELLRVHAGAVRVVGSDTVGVPNVVFDWSSVKPTLATVRRDTGGSATVTGVNSGTVDIVARAANFDKAGPGALTIRVANPLEIDSVRPRITRYGEVLRVYGIGVDSIFLSTLGGVDLIPYPFSATRNSKTGEGRVSYWVPPPATSANLFYLGAGVFGFADSVTKVVPRDFFGSDFLRCKGQAFSPALAPRESTVVALRGLPSHSMHVLTSFAAARPERYGLTVIKGYSVADPRIQPDKYEPNNFCHYADFGVRRISLPSSGSTFSDTLTIDNPFDIDWLRIDLPGSLTTQVKFRTAARPFPTEPDTSDVDVYVLTVPNSSTSTGLTVVGADTTAGSTDSVTLTLNAGPSSSYYVAIVDFAGVPARYSLCIARATLAPACPPPIPLAAAASLATANSVVRARRHRAAATLPFLHAAPPRAGTRGLFDPWRLTLP